MEMKHPTELRNSSKKFSQNCHRGNFFIQKISLLSGLSDNGDGITDIMSRCRGQFVHISSSEVQEESDEFDSENDDHENDENEQ